jgi:hypothetical protein
MIIGTQIAYIPNHAEGEISHPDVKFGFVTKHEEGASFAICRYWRNGELGTLRTTTTGEATPIENLIEHETVSQSIVEKELIRLGFKN